MAHSVSIPSTAKELNVMHQQFWLKQSELLNRRICDKDLYEIAMSMLESEQRMMVPVKNRKTLEGALEKAPRLRARPTIIEAGFTPTCGAVAFSKKPTQLFGRRSMMMIMALERTASAMN